MNNPLLVVLVVFSLSLPVHATSYRIVGVEQGDNGLKFQYSGLHSIPNPAKPMDGETIVMLDLLKYGYYDDVSGKLAVGFTWNAVDGRTGVASFSAATPALFGADGFLSSDTEFTLKYLENTPGASSETATFDFAAGNVCCGGAGDSAPNSLVAENGFYYINLWGWSQDFPEPGHPYVGMDLRLKMTVVPLPAAAWLMLTAFAGLGFWRRSMPRS